MNRDEDKLRLEKGPTVLSNDNIHVFMPIDVASQGSWIGGNSLGIAACLLNRYDTPPRSDAISRGSIIPSTLLQGDINKITQWLKNGLTPEEYNPFTLLVINKNSLFRYDWDGNLFSSSKISTREPYMLSSSSWVRDNVLAWRASQFEEWIKEGWTAQEGIPDFHVLQPEENKAWAPLMERETAHTKSICQIIIDQYNIKINYWPINHSNNNAMSSTVSSQCQSLEINTAEAICL